ncbi:MAG: PcfB family protein, partial [Oscillospiraceae bacterium]|nr:PcfB family protein [Oscillospiraceae bacterium]
DDNIKDFDPIARKYGIGYALQVDDSTQPPTWVVLFKCKDVDAMTAAFKEFSKKVLEKEADKKPSVREAVREHNRTKTAVKIQAKDKGIDKNAIKVRVKSKDKGVPEL